MGISSVSSKVSRDAARRGLLRPAMDLDTADMGSSSRLAKLYGAILFSPSPVLANVERRSTNGHSRPRCRELPDHRCCQGLSHFSLRFLKLTSRQFVVENQECQLTHSFNLTVAPTSTIDSSFSRSRRPSLVGDPPRRSTSDSALFQAPQRSVRPSVPDCVTMFIPVFSVRAKRPAQVLESADTRVKRVLENVAQRVTEEAESQFVSTSPPEQGALQDLVKQKHVLEQTVDAYDREITGQGHSQTRRLAVAAQNVVVQAAHRVIADRTVATGGIPTQQSETTAMQSVTVGELTDATQDAIATAVKRNGTASTEVDIIVAATSILKARTPILDIVPSSVQQQPRPPLPGAGSTRFTAGTNLSPLPEYV